MQITQQPFRTFIVMLIHQISIQFTSQGPTFLKIVPVRKGPRSGDQFNMRIGGTNRLVNHGKPLFKLRGNLVLITNTQKFKVKSLLATSSSTYRTPFAVGRSGSPFNQV